MNMFKCLAFSSRSCKRVLCQQAKSEIVKVFTKLRSNETKCEQKWLLHEVSKISTG